MGVLIRNNIVNQKGTPAFYEDTLTNRPVANLQGRMFVSIDTAAIYRDTGSAWVLIADATGPVTGFVPYTGATANVNLGSFGFTASSLSIPTLTTGSVLFAGTSGLISQDNTNLFWDDTNNFLGIGPTGGPTALLDIHSPVQNIFVQLNATSTNNSQLAFLNGGVGKWRIGNLYNAAANDFHIYDTTNSVSRLTIKNTGLATYTGYLNVNNIASAQNIQISGTAPAYTIIDVAGSGYAASLGMATIANNFIQGSVLGDLCFVNQNTGGGNIKFAVGSSNAATINISSANRVQIGTSTDAGYKLDVNGTARVQTSAYFATTSGVVGIGTTTPVGNLDVVGIGTSNSVNVNIQCTGGGIPIHNIWFGNANSASAGGRFAGIRANMANDRMSLMMYSTSLGTATERLTIDINGNVGINTLTPSASAILELSNTTKGFLPPRMTTTQKNAIATPASGLVVYDTTLNKLALYTGAAWETVTSI